jgi:hypothetical protein
MAATPCGGGRVDLLLATSLLKSTIRSPPGNPSRSGSAADPQAADGGPRCAAPSRAVRGHDHARRDKTASCARGFVHTLTPAGTRGLVHSTGVQRGGRVSRTAGHLCATGGVRPTLVSLPPLRAAAVLPLVLSLFPGTPPGAARRPHLGDPQAPGRLRLNESLARLQSALPAWAFFTRGGG